VDATVTKQKFHRIITNQELWELHKTTSLVADISRIYVWLDNSDARVATKKSFECKPDYKGCSKPGSCKWKVKTTI
jgi:hypothetical protein